MEVDDEVWGMRGEGEGSVSLFRITLRKCLIVNSKMRCLSVEGMLDWNI